MNKLGFRKVFFTSAVAVAVLFSGCGSDDDKKNNDSNITSGELGDVTDGTDDSGIVGGTDDSGNQASGLVIGKSISVEVPANVGTRYSVTDLNPNDTDSTYKKVDGVDENRFYVFKTGGVQFNVHTDTAKDEDGDNVYHLIVEESAADGTVTNIELNVTVN